jgi:hypothetical protein
MKLGLERLAIATLLMLWFYRFVLIVQRWLWKDGSRRPHNVSHQVMRGNTGGIVKL